MVCEKVQTKLICPSCLTAIGSDSPKKFYLCSICGIPISPSHLQCNSCITSPPAYDQVRYIDSYDGLLQNALHALKYQKRLACASGFAHLWNSIAGMVDEAYHADYLLPVPLSDSKLAQRGFNQSWEIARNLQLPKELVRTPKALGRKDDVGSQVSRGRSERKAITHDVFYCNQAWSNQFESKRIILFDDVMTTGATIDAIASLLKNHGAKHVSAWIVLRALPKTA